jgi:hypothetical protein
VYRRISDTFTDVTSGLLKEDGSAYDGVELTFVDAPSSSDFITAMVPDLYLFWPDYANRPSFAPNILSWKSFGTYNANFKFQCKFSDSSITLQNVASAVSSNYFSQPMIMVTSKISVL